jgi:octaprenyl-diphosphate synthase
MSSTATHTPSAAAILAPIAADMEQVNRVIRQSLASEVMLINQISEYIIGAGGKRLRPALLLLVAGALGDRSTHRHELAAVVEFIHTATLLHDDVVDESDLRRGRQTANALFGNAASVLVGDYLYSRSFEMMVGVGKMRVMEILSQATTIISEGEVLQLLNMHDADVDVSRYMQVIRYKTAKLFEAAAQLGAVLSGSDARTEEAAAEFGRRIGTAFQLMDDWLDYAGTAEAMGKNAGDDLREGKPTLPLIWLIEHGTAAEAALAREAITRSGALDHTLECARAEAQAAADAISAFPSSIYKESLLELCSYSTTRQS